MLGADWSKPRLAPGAALRLLHDADGAVQLALGIVVVDVGIGAARVVGAAVLEQDVRALLAARSPSVGQRRLATGVSALHVHPVLLKRYVRLKSTYASIKCMPEVLLVNSCAL